MSDKKEKPEPIAEDDSEAGGDAPQDNEANSPETEDDSAASEPDGAAPEQITPEEQIAQLKERLMRALAEVENTRRRAERQVSDSAQYAIAGFARDMLTLSDNLHRTLSAINDELRANESVAAFIEGLEMTERELMSAFDRHGIVKITPEGEKYDHNYHEAMFKVEDPSAEPGTIVQVIQPGYVLRGRLLRAAMVGVARAPDVPPEKVDTTA